MISIQRNNRCLWTSTSEIEDKRYCTSWVLRPRSMTSMIQFTPVRKTILTLIPQARATAAAFKTKAPATKAKRTRQPPTTPNSNPSSSRYRPKTKSRARTTTSWKNVSCLSLSWMSKTWTTTQRTTTRRCRPFTGRSTMLPPPPSTSARSPTTPSTAAASWRRCKTIQSWTSARACFTTARTILSLSQWSRRRNRGRATRRRPPGGSMSKGLRKRRTTIAS